jgi:hypothetical protein
VYHGARRWHSSVRSQRGDGFGSILRGLARFFLPIVGRGIGSFATHTLDAVDRGVSLGEAAKSALKPTLRTVIDSVGGGGATRSMQGGSMNVNGVVGVGTKKKSKKRARKRKQQQSGRGALSSSTIGGGGNEGFYARMLAAKRRKASSATKAKQQQQQSGKGAARRHRKSRKQKRQQSGNGVRGRVRVYKSPKSCIASYNF